MIGISKRRKQRKLIKEHLHMARHARHMREDIADPADLEALDAAEAAVREIRETGQGELEPALEVLEAASDKIYPNRLRTGMRENIEILIVVLAAVTAIRAFFFLPFKIPTGSMQPTLNGITIEAQSEPGITDYQPIKFFKWLLTGESYKVVRAKASGTIQGAEQAMDKVVLYIGGVGHKIPTYMLDGHKGFDPNHYYKKGDPIVGAKVIAGDHIIVNKMKYNFMRPERGDISVFDTRSLDPATGVRAGNFYIKRMVGLAGEKIQIQNGRIVADGEIVNDPPMFEKIATDPAYNGGHGNAARLSTPASSIQLADDEYLMCGDNTKPGMSLDGRFFGGVPREDFQGPAIFVYWPFREHWGVVR